MIGRRQEDSCGRSEAAQEHLQYSKEEEPSQTFALPRTSILPEDGRASANPYLLLSCSAVHPNLYTCMPPPLESGQPRYAFFLTMEPPICLRHNPFLTRSWQKHQCHRLLLGQLLTKRGQAQSATDHPVCQVSF